MQKTELKYMDHMHLYEDEAKVLDMKDGDNDLKVIILDQTIFYPQGGGQPSDIGVITTDSAEFSVEHVAFVDGMVEHVGSFSRGEIKPGDTVKLLVDEKTRIMHSKLHAAGHLIDTVVFDMVGKDLVPSKGYQFPDGPNVEYEGIIPEDKREQFKKELEDGVNDRIRQGFEISAKFAEKDDLESMCTFVPDYIPKDKPVRVAVVWGEKGLPCGGTYVKNISEIGSVAIKKIKCKKGSTKVSYSVEGLDEFNSEKGAAEKEQIVEQPAGSMKFKLSSEFVKEFPDAVEYIVIAKGINNEIAGKSIVDETKKIAKEIQEKGKKILDQPKYQKWVEVYEKMSTSAGLKTKEFSASHVALTKRILSGKDLPNINPVVNFYNMYSVKHGVPIGGENLAAVYGDTVLDISKGGDLYLGIGEGDVVKTSPGEVMWKDDHSITCRMWNWRQSERTKLTSKAKDVYFVFDGFVGTEGVDLAAITRKFADELIAKFGGTVEIGVIDKDNIEFEVQYATKDISGVDVEGEMQRNLSGGKKKKGKKKIMKRKAVSMGLMDEKHLPQRLTALVDTAVENLGYSQSSELEQSQNKQFGDFSSTVALRLAKELRENPRRIAENIVSELEDSEEMGSIFSDVSVAPNGFINFVMSESGLVSELSSALSQGDSYGVSIVGAGKTILVESPSINPNAAAHAGHLLNLFIGRSLKRLFEKVGFDAKTDNLINDRGIKICMAMWGVENLAEKKTPEDAGMKSDHYVGKYYALTKEKYHSDEKVKAEIDQMLRDWEAGKPEIMKLWEKVIKWAFDGHLQTFERLHEERGRLWLESEHFKGGKKIIMEHLGKGVIEKGDDGAVFARLEDKYGVPDAILLRSDGTSLYHTQDLALTLRKIEKFHPWRAIWVVGNEHIPHFQQNFALLDALGILKLDQVYHFAYGIVVDKDGNRIGKGSENANADDLLDQMHEAALRVMDQREIDVELDDKNKVAEAVGAGALRFAFLSKDPFKNVVYDPDSALSFTGRSGPYIMYAYSRGKSVLEKAFEGGNYKVPGADMVQSDSVRMGGAEFTEVDKELILKLLQYPEVVLTAANNYAPNILAEYLFEVASKFNNFYEKETTAGAEGDTRKLRVAMTQLTTNVIKSGLEILGIEVLEKM